MQLICFSHLSWKFVYQRPQHLLSRFTKKYTVLLYRRVYLKSLKDGYSLNINSESVMCNCSTSKYFHTRQTEPIMSYHATLVAGILD